MKLDHTGIDTVKTDLNLLDDTMKEYGLERGEHWDYERVTYDRKFEINEGVYYLRIFGVATEGDVGANKATIQLLTPLLGKHYYPHGVEYGQDEVFPDDLVKQCEKILKNVKSQLDEFLPTK
ncbi:YugN family protein [Niallia sp. XMNu-256]|uniref:YugN family protein n=1 Tax=Niallia sp. XMNu-256 TaxID=3082444 RepID=UPI0030CB5BCB